MVVAVYDEPAAEESVLPLFAGVFDREEFRDAGLIKRRAEVPDTGGVLVVADFLPGIWALIQFLYYHMLAQFATLGSDLTNLFHSSEGESFQATAVEKKGDHFSDDL